ncbi:hypothetical protein ACFXKJ_34205 [Kitasatospora indigofera]|uniref:hypothetical protein n=1 Tax=Kitasatospora indigofera TaxID=67307 RepID=UPI0036A3A85E
MDQSFDARGIKATGGIDARGIKAPPAPPGCPECGTALRASGPGRRPVYCSRACSSKAYRKRRTESQQDAVADALVSSRVEIPAGADGGEQELLDLAAAVQRATARYLQQLDQAQRGEGDDPRCNQALQRLDAAVTGATQRLVRQAHVLRYEMTSARLRAERAAATIAPIPATPVGPAGTAPAAPPAGPDANLVPTRVESAGPAVNLVPTRVESAGRPTANVVPARVETDRPGVDIVPPLVPTPDRGVPDRAALTPAPEFSVSPRVETPGPVLGVAHQQLLTADRPSRSTVPRPSAAAPTSLLRSAAPQPVVAEVPEQLRLALAEQRTSTSPLARGLGAPTDTWNVPGSDLVLEGWGADPGLFAVRRPDRRLVGWIAAAGDGGGWSAFVDGRQVVDAADGEPWLSQGPQHAVSLLQAALDPRST